MIKKWLKLIKSVSASMLGVQSHKNYEEDFAEQSALPFIVTGIFLVVIFVISLIVFVNILV
ncbi:MAG: hypothetical protein ACI97K_001176 [Glaciecola sp.]|jgi:hypothetical protein